MSHRPEDFGEFPDLGVLGPENAEGPELLVHGEDPKRAKTEFLTALEDQIEAIERQEGGWSDREAADAAETLSDGPGSFEVQPWSMTQGEVKLVLTLRLVGAGELVVEDAHWEAV